MEVYESHYAWTCPSPHNELLSLSMLDPIIEIVMYTWGALFYQRALAQEFTVLFLLSIPKMKTKAEEFLVTATITAKLMFTTIVPVKPRHAHVMSTFW